MNHFMVNGGARKGYLQRGSAEYVFKETTLDGGDIIIVPNLSHFFVEYFKIRHKETYSN